MNGFRDPEEASNLCSGMKMVSKVPDGVDKALYLQFINSECTECDELEGGCTEISPEYEQTKVCFEEWKDKMS